MITIDTEEDNWGEYTEKNPTLKNIDKIHYLNDLFEKYNIKASYLITYPIAVDQKSVGILKPIMDQGQCEIGTHPHPWNTPPFVEAKNERNSMLCNLPPGLQYNKIEYLHNAIRDNFGIEPISFRSGRWGYNEDVAKNIFKLGYKVDSSISPYTNWKAVHGPDFSKLSPEPYRFSVHNIYRKAANGDLLEIPATIGYRQRNFNVCNAINRRLHTMSLNKLRIPGLLKKLNIINKTLLSPESSTIDDMIKLTEAMIKNNYTLINMFFHSPSLKAGLTKFTRTKSDENEILNRIEGFLIFSKERGFNSIKLSEYIDILDK